MVKCNECGVEIEGLPFICTYCGKSYCADHRLPEAHSCPNLVLARAPPFNLRETSTEERGTISSLRDRILDGSELKQLLIAWIVLGFCFSVRGLFTPTLFPTLFGVSLVTLGFGFLAHELAHRYIARRYGYQAGFRLWPLGLVIALVSALLSGGRWVFASPGAVYITHRYFGSGYRDQKKINGLIALSGPLVNILVAFIFLSVSGLGELLGFLGSNGFRVNLWLAAYNLLPFGMMDGRKVFSWNPLIWAIVAIPAWALSLFS
jgi:Zn-dependent protease